MGLDAGHSTTLQETLTTSQMVQAYTPEIGFRDRK